MNGQPHPVAVELIEATKHEAAKPVTVDGVVDQYYQMFAVALAETLEQSEEIGDHYAAAITRKRCGAPYPGKYAFNHTLRDIQREVMHDPTYPFHTADDWRELVHSRLDDETSRSNILDVDMQIWHVGSDVETRAAGIKLAAHLLRPSRAADEQQPLTILNVGSSRDHALAMLEANLTMEVTVDATAAISRRTRTSTERVVHSLLNKEVLLGDCYGIDLWPLRDPEWSSYVESCRYYPLERTDPVKRSRYQELETIRDAADNLHHTEVDFSEIDGQPNLLNGWLRGLETDHSYDIVAFPTSLYQNYREKQKIMFQNACRLLKEDGLIIVQDFCDVSPPSPDEHPIEQLTFLGPNPIPFTYKTVIYDSQHPEVGFQTFASWNNGRCEIVRPESLLLQTMFSPPDHQ